MLRSLRLQNFQAHADTTVEFAPGISTLVGPTDVGKSAVLRALRWVCLNDISGDEFIREGTKQTTVTLQTTHGTITRVRGQGENTYDLEDKIYRAFGTTVPEDVADLLQVNGINFQSQHDSPFWFNETAGEVSRRLNAVIDLSVIDAAMSFLASEVRSATERESLVQERLAQAQTKHAQLEPQRARLAQFEKLEALHAQAHDARQECDSLRRRLERAVSEQEIRNRKSAQAEEGGDVVAAGRAWWRVQDQASRIAALTRQAQLTLQEVKKAPPDFSSVTQARDAWQKTASKAETLRALLETIRNRTYTLNVKRQAAQEKEREFHEQIIGQACPLCGGTIEKPK